MRRRESARHSLHSHDRGGARLGDALVMDGGPADGVRPMEYSTRSPWRRSGRVDRGSGHPGSRARSSLDSRSWCATHPLICGRPSGRDAGGSGPTFLPPALPHARIVPDRSQRWRLGRGQCRIHAGSGPSNHLRCGPGNVDGTQWVGEVTGSGLVPNATYRTGEGGSRTDTAPRAAGIPFGPSVP